MTLRTAIIFFLLLVVVFGGCKFKKALNSVYKAGYSDGYSAYQLKTYIPSDIPLKRKDIRLKEKR